MGDGSTIIAGLAIPSTDPLFLSLVALHIALALVCVIAGAVAMLSWKGPGRHPSAGTIYFWSLAGVCASAAILSAMRWGEDFHLFILATLAFSAAYIGRHAKRRRWNGWVRVHIAAMGSSYILLLTAFYVDNGKQLPLWRDLPPWTYWTVPAIVGLPIIVWALLRHRLVQTPSR